jgi:nitrite reductase (NADH) small subunit
MTLLDPTPTATPTTTAPLGLEIDHTAGTATRPASEPAHDWVDVCAFDDLVPDVGVAALVGGEPVAVFRCWPDDTLYAVGNHDPYSGAGVLARGIVGSIGDRPVVASPIYKQRFDLRTGEALEDAATRIPTYATRIRHDRVQVGRPRTAHR